MDDVIRRLRRIAKEELEGATVLSKNLFEAIEEMDQVLADLADLHKDRTPIRQKICRIMIRLGQCGIYDELKCGQSEDRLGGPGDPQVSRGSWPEP